LKVYLFHRKHKNITVGVAICKEYEKSEQAVIKSGEPMQIFKRHAGTYSNADYITRTVIKTSLSEIGVTY